MNDDIIGYVFDGLDPDQQEAIEKEIERDPNLRAEIERARKLLLPLADDDRIDPPPGLADRCIDRVRWLQMSASRDDWWEASPRLRPVDFMVAVSVLFLATMLVFPAIATLRGDQARVICADNLRKLGFAMASYADHEQGWLPYVDKNGPLNNAGVFAVMLKSCELVTDNRDLLCPSADSGLVTVPKVDEVVRISFDNPKQSEQIRRVMGGSYGYLLGYQESDGGHGFWRRSDMTPVVSDRPPRATETASINSPNHNGRGQNVLFADGVVRWLGTPVFGYDNLFRRRNGGIGAGLDRNDIVIGVSEATPYPICDL